MNDQEAGTMAFTHWASAPKVFTTGSVGRKHIGRLVIGAGLGEADVVLLADHWRAEPAAALTAMVSVLGGSTSTTPRITADTMTPAVLTAALEAAQSWRRRIAPGPARTVVPPGYGRAAQNE